MTFLPPEDVVDPFELRSDDEAVPAEFISYLESTYIGIQLGRGELRRRIEPLFPIDVWNVPERDLNDQPRINNTVESFHSALRVYITRMHPICGSFVLHYKKKELSDKRNCCTSAEGMGVKNEKRKKNT